jgi:hypothetical protein
VVRAASLVGRRKMTWMSRSSGSMEKRSAAAIVLYVKGFEEEA